MKRKLGYELITFGHLLKWERDRAFEKIKNRVLMNDKDVMSTDLIILKFLVDNESKEVYQKDIEKFFNLTAPSVSHKLQQLQKRNLIDRVYSTKDTRLKRVIVTKRGIEIDAKIRNEMEVFEDQLVELITEDEKQQLLLIIDKLKNGFNK